MSRILQVSQEAGIRSDHWHRTAATHLGQHVAGPMRPIGVGLCGPLLLGHIPLAGGLPVGTPRLAVDVPHEQPPPRHPRHHCHQRVHMHIAVIVHLQDMSKIWVQFLGPPPCFTARHLGISSHAFTVWHREVWTWVLHPWSSFVIFSIWEGGHIRIIFQKENRKRGLLAMTNMQFRVRAQGMQYILTINQSLRFNLTATMVALVRVRPWPVLVCHLHPFCTGVASKIDQDQGRGEQ